MTGPGGPRAERGIGLQVVALVLALFLAMAMAVQPVRQLFRQRGLMVSMTDDLRHLRNSNATLQARIERLEDPDYLEQRAREQTGLVRPGETTFIVMPPSRRSKEHRERPGRGERERSEPPGGFLERLLHFVGIG